MEVETRTKRGLWLYLLGSLGLLLLAVAMSAGAAMAGAPSQAPPAQDNGKADMPQAQPQLKPQAQGSGPVISTDIPAPAVPYVVLYDQYNNAVPNASSSQDFEAANDPFDDQTADDFPVPSGQNWQINEVDLQGLYYNGPGPAASFNVFFYTNSGTLPATPVYTATNLAYTNTTGNFVIPLTTPANLTGGATYWVSVQARQDFSPAGQFGWQDRTVTSNSPAAFRNPGGGFACSGGNGWVAKTTCAAGTEPDQVFRLNGSIVTATSTTTGTPTAAASPTCSPGGGPGPWTAALPYPKIIGRYGFAQVGNSFYVVGGVSAGVRVTDTNRYDVATNAWTALAPIPVASEAPTCAYLSSNNKIYCAQGDTGNSFQIYDVASNTWTTGPPVPGTANRYGAVSGAFNGKVYVAGGSSAVSADAQVYTVATNSWAAASPIPSGVLLPGYQPVGQYLYVVGGFTSTPLANNNSAAGAASSVLDRANGTGGGGAGRPQAPDANIAATYRLDMNTGIWSTGPVFTPQRADFGLAYDSVAGKIFAIGGDATGGGYFDSTALVDELDVSTWPAGTWAASSPVLPSARQGNQAGFYSTGRIWSTGGFNSSIVFTNEHLFRTTTGNAPCATTTSTVTSTATETATATTQATNTTTSTAISSATTQATSTQTATVAASNTVPAATSTITTQPSTTGTNTAISTSTGTAIASATSTATVCNIKFSDVPPTGEGSTFYPFIQCLACRGIVTGYMCGGTNPQTGLSEVCNAARDGYYRPNNNVTRGELSKIVALSAKLTYVIPSNQRSFHDVLPGDTFYVYIEQLAQNGAISGYQCGPMVVDPLTGDTLTCDEANRPWFRYNNPATRGQISKIVAIAAGFNEALPANQQTFTDVPQNSPFWQYIERLAQRHIIGGYSDAAHCGAGIPCFRYNDFTSRGQMAKFAANAFFPNCQTRAKP